MNSSHNSSNNKENEIYTPLDVLINALRRWAIANRERIGDSWVKRIFKETSRLSKVSHSETLSPSTGAGYALWAFAFLRQFIPIAIVVYKHERSKPRIVISNNNKDGDGYNNYVIAKGYDPESTKELIEAIEINIVSLSSLLHDQEEEEEEEG
ncbi:MAG: hypothetical protein QW052_07270 [Candidatus Nitrosocaldaceae archaeon]